MSRDIIKGIGATTRWVETESMEETAMNAQIGEAAGKVWQALEADGPMAKTTLKSKTKLDSDLLGMALGWLAREDKVAIEKVGKRKIQVNLR